MSAASRSETLVLSFILFACLIAAAHAELPTLEFEEGTPVQAGASSQPITIGHRRPHAGAIPHDVRRDTARNEEEFDRKFGMCRRC